MKVTRRQYQAPAMKVTMVQQMQMICSSNGSFTVSQKEVTEGRDGDWSETDLDW